MIVYFYEFKIDNDLLFIIQYLNKIMEMGTVR